MTHHKIDQQALKASKDFRKCESELLEIIMKVDDLKVYRKLGYPSLFQYVVKRLGLSEAQAYSFISVGRKSKEVPQIKEKIKNGELTVSKAKKITSVITAINQGHWLSLAQSASQKKVEREVALAKPKQAIWNKMTYVSASDKVVEKVQIKKNSPQVKMEVGLSEKLMLKLRRAQDLVSQKKQSSVNLEITLEALVDEYIKKHDPLEKAKRQKIKGRLKLKTEQVLRTEIPVEEKMPSRPPVQSIKHQRVSKRKALPAHLKHQVYLNNNGQCSATDKKGKRCGAQRFLEIHHIKPISHGGIDKLENLTLLCTGHHQVAHDSLF